MRAVLKEVRWLLSAATSASAYSPTNKKSSSSSQVLAFAHASIRDWLTDSRRPPPPAPSGAALAASTGPVPTTYDTRIDVREAHAKLARSCLQALFGALPYQSFSAASALTAASAASTPSLPQDVHHHPHHHAHHSPRDIAARDAALGDVQASGGTLIHTSTDSRR